MTPTPRRNSFYAIVALLLAASFDATAACPFSIAAQGSAQMVSDGLLHLRSARATAIGSVAPNSGAQQSESAISASIAADEAALDVNGSGRFDIDDAAIIVRYLAGFRGATLASTALDATRQSGDAIEAYINNGCPANPCDAPVARVLQVGPGRTYATPSAAASVALNGDIVKIDAGIYLNEVATWSANNLTLCGVGGRAKLYAPSVIPNGKAIWVIRGNDVIVDNIEFYNAKVPDQNGAGIRTEGINLTISNSGFFDNENGILGGSAGTIAINRSEFARNGFQTGQAHNLYINQVDRLLVANSFFHEVKIGHNLKSRAKVTRIENSYFMDGPTGTASYQTDFSNGGAVYLRGNVFQKGPNADNSIAIAYGQEGLVGSAHTLEMVHNTVVMTRPGGAFVVVRSGTQSVKLTANLFAGTNGPALFTGTYDSASAILQNNFTTTASNIPGADNIAQPAFWPIASVQGLISLASAPDVTHIRDAPRPFQLRPIIGANRLIGAIQSAP
jgi:hypothetical protein